MAGRCLTEPGRYERLEVISARLAVGLEGAAAHRGIEACVNRVGSMLTAFFTPGPVTEYASACTADTRRYAAFFHGMLARGVYLAPSQFEAAFVSCAHDEGHVDATLAAAREVLASV